MRHTLVVLALAGCDTLWGIYEVPPPSDAAIDTPPIDAPPEIGCADGSREAFSDVQKYPAIAGCNGGWSRPGISTPPTACGASGNTSANPTGIGCSIANLCAPTWHVCRNPAEVMQATSGDGCTPIQGTIAFYTTQTTGSGAGNCDFAGSDDFFGCGTIGNGGVQASCAPLDRLGYGTGIDTSCHLDVGGWDCSGPTNAEALDVTKRMDDSGGALCCK